MGGWLHDYTIVFKGGPNSGVIMGGSGAITPREGKAGPFVGDSTMFVPHWSVASVAAVGAQEAVRIREKVGIPAPETDKYTIESIDDDLIVYRHVPKS